MYKRRFSSIHRAGTAEKDFLDDNFQEQTKRSDGTLVEAPKKTLYHFLKKRACSVLLSLVIVIVAIILWNLEMWHLANVQAANKITFTSDAFHPININRFGRP